MNLKLTDNWLWDLYNTTKVKVNHTYDNPLSAHDMKTSEVFDTLSTSDTEQPCEEKIDKSGIASSPTVTLNNVSTTNMLTECNNIGEATLDEIANDDELYLDSLPTDTV